jgi:molybdopterin converting factor subunit 1
MHLKVLYFAQLRERFALSEEVVITPASVTTVADLIHYLSTRGGVWLETFTGGAAFRVAVNQDMVGLDTALTDGAEIAIFRPVTGG